MAMIGELFASFESLKNAVEKISEMFEKGADSRSMMVCVFDGTFSDTRMMPTVVD